MSGLTAADFKVGDTPDLYNVLLSLPARFEDGRVALFAPELGEQALAFTAMRVGRSHRADWILTWLFDGAPDRDAIRTAMKAGAAALDYVLSPGAWRIEKVSDVNWLEQCYQQFQPFTVGPFFIYGSHHEGAPPADLLPLQIDAATAFGSGEHGTTAGCLRALALLKDQGFVPGSVLDMGTGSGILAVAAARLWASPIVAVDIDPESVIVCDRHAAMNGVADRIACSAGEGFAAVQETFDLVIANILAGPLINMARDLVGHVAPNGVFILSGMLTEQAAEVAVAYTARGCVLEKTFTQEPWDAQLWRRSV